MARATNKQIAAAFRKAKPYLARNKQELENTCMNGYICHAIDDGSDNFDAANAAISIIGNRLGRFVEGGHRHTAFSYLQKVVGVPIDELTDDKVQAWRHAWLDSLIAEYQHKKD